MKILFVSEMSLCAFVVGFSLPAAAAEPVVQMRHTEKQNCDSCCCSFSFFLLCCSRSSSFWRERNRVYFIMMQAQIILCVKMYQDANYSWYHYVNFPRHLCLLNTLNYSEQNNLLSGHLKISFSCSKESQTFTPVDSYSVIMGSQNEVWGMLPEIGFLPHWRLMLVP